MRVIKQIQKICLNSTPAQSKIELLSEIRESIHCRLYMYKQIMICKLSRYKNPSQLAIARNGLLDLWSQLLQLLNLPVYNKTENNNSNNAINRVYYQQRVTVSVN